ncbi:MAG: hypothetical protein Q9187_005412 [Circinaria calcarea]
MNRHGMHMSPDAPAQAPLKDCYETGDLVPSIHEDLADDSSTAGSLTTANSLSSQDEPSLSSQSSAQVIPRVVSDRLFAIFSLDDVLRSAHKEAPSRMSRERFERKFISLLNQYSYDLRLKARYHRPWQPSGYQIQIKGVIRFLRRHARLFAQRISKEFYSVDDDTKRQQMEDIAHQKPEKETQLELYLSHYNPEAVSSSSEVYYEISSFLEDESEAESEPEDGYLRISNVTRLKHFLVESSSFELDDSIFEQLRARWLEILYADPTRTTIEGELIRMGNNLTGLTNNRIKAEIRTVMAMSTVEIEGTHLTLLDPSIDSKGGDLNLNHYLVDDLAQAINAWSRSMPRESAYQNRVYVPIHCFWTVPELGKTLCYKILDAGNFTLGWEITRSPGFSTSELRRLRKLLRFLRLPINSSFLPYDVANYTSCGQKDVSFPASVPLPHIIILAIQYLRLVTHIRAREAAGGGLHQPRKKVLMGMSTKAAGLLDTSEPSIGKSGSVKLKISRISAVPEEVHSQIIAPDSGECDDRLLNVLHHRTIPLKYYEKVFKPFLGMIRGWNSYFRPPPKAGYRRVEWICALVEVQVPHQPPPPQQRRRRLPQAPAQLAIIVQPIQQTNTLQIKQAHKFLELCVNTGEFTKSLGEIEISQVRSDGNLFREIKSQYLRLRGYRAKHFLLKPVAVQFVQFSLEERHQVGILDFPLALPPETEVIAKRYEYDPCPLRPPPPIPSHIFLHYLNSSREHPRSLWLDRLPKKLTESIKQSTDPLPIGWGIHIIEGPNRRAMFWITVLIVLLSIIVSTTWTAVKGDIQGGFGLGAWIVSVPGVLMMAFFFKWSED